MQEIIMIDSERSMIAKMRFPMFTTKSVDLEETKNFASQL